MKNLTLKVAMVAVATFIGLGSFAQNNGTTDWVKPASQTIGKYNRSAATPITVVGSVVYTDYITVGKTMPFFVWPSAAYNPTWNPAFAFATPAFPLQSELQTGVQSTFNWKIGSGTTPALAQTALGTATPIVAFTKNYVEIAAGATAGNVTLVSVEEKAPSATCNAAPVYFGFTSIAAPTVTVTNTPLATKFGLDQVIVFDCDGNAPLTLAVNATLAPAQESNWHLNMPYKVYTVSALTGGGNIDLGAAINYTATSTVKVFGNDGSTVPSVTNPKIIASSPAAIVASQAYIVQDNKITVYEFDVVSSSATISRKSDYIDRSTGTLTGTYGFTYYPSGAANTKYYIIALPKPVTGPIYHIANNFAY